MALGILAEAMVRIEHKIDLLLYHLKVPGRSMQFVDRPCPVCLQIVEYRIDLMKNVVTRKCGCASGMQPSSIPLFPVAPQGEVHGNAPRSLTATAADDPEDRLQRPPR